MTTYYANTAGSNTSPYDTEAKGATAIGTIIAIPVAAGDIINVKAGTYAEKVVIAVAGTATAPIKMIGYTTTPGDGGVATIDPAGGQTGSITCTGANYWRFQNLKLQGGTARCIDFLTTTSSYQRWINCELTKGGSTASVGFDSSSYNQVTYSQFYGCIIHDIASSISAGGGPVGSGTKFFACYIYNITNTGFTVGSYAIGFFVENCVIRNCGSHGILIPDNTVTDSFFVRGNTIVSNAGSGIYFNGVTSQLGQLIENNLIAFNHAYGITASGTLLPGGVEIRNNFFYSNTSGRSANVTMDNYTDLSGDPFVVSPSAYNVNPVNNASVNLSLNATAGAGASVRAGVSFSFGLATSYVDGGAVQHADPVIACSPAHGTAAQNIYNGTTVTADGTALYTGTLHVSNIATPAGAGVNLSAGILSSGSTVDDVAGSASGGGGGQPFIGVSPMIRGLQ